ncbi:hypothetical protein SPI_03802 [Niveomyces insectorum RCEF 264]|uniref:Tse2 ADP-ribosyltransferase toxin domain-containing protein n=1 Tax=Niveomyces insectorum RCEF 264 TaxID=1081102 RepID=A0A167WDA6_9HYPO|nr:hypothetical protein SPI_03802 [Niveomyces insectorum RCEF 264]
MPPNLIAVFNTLPKELFRVNNGPYVRLRDWSVRRQVYDVVSQNGRIMPKALDASTYQAPNGASMRPNSPYQQRLVRHIFKGTDVLVYAVPAGTRLPMDLILVHERSDHYSLQPARMMTIDDLNTKITDFLQRKGRIYKRDDWLKTYPTATEPYVPNITEQKK